MGSKRAQLDWRVSDQDVADVKTSLELVAKELMKAGFGPVTFGDPAEFETMEGGGGNADGNRWDPEHMKHPRHDKIGEWAQTNAYGQAPTPSPSPPSTLTPTLHVGAYANASRTKIQLESPAKWVHIPGQANLLRGFPR